MQVIQSIQHASSLQVSADDDSVFQRSVSEAHLCEEHECHHLGIPRKHAISIMQHTNEAREGLGVTTSTVCLLKALQHSVVGGVSTGSRSTGGHSEQAQDLSHSAVHPGMPRRHWQLCGWVQLRASGRRRDEAGHQAFQQGSMHLHGCQRRLHFDGALDAAHQRLHSLHTRGLASQRKQRFQRIQAAVGNELFQPLHAASAELNSHGVHEIQAGRLGRAVLPHGGQEVGVVSGGACAVACGAAAFSGLLRLGGSMLLHHLPLLRIAISALKRVRLQHAIHSGPRNACSAHVRGVVSESASALHRRHAPRSAIIARNFASICDTMHKRATTLESD